MTCKFQVGNFVYSNNPMCVCIGLTLCREPFAAQHFSTSGRHLGEDISVQWLHYLIPFMNLYFSIRSSFSSMVICHVAMASKGVLQKIMHAQCKAARVG